jgi:hypothetical protein
MIFYNYPILWQCQFLKRFKDLNSIEFVLLLAAVYLHLYFFFFEKHIFMIIIMTVTVSNCNILPFLSAPFSISLLES